MTGFRRVGERELLDHGGLIKVAEATFEAPDGARFARTVVHHPGWVAVVPLLDGGGSVLCVRQYRGPVGGELLEIPAGIRDVDGEAPEVTAARELAEEVGRRADRLELLAEVRNSPGFCDEAGRIYLGTGLTEVPVDLHGPEEQHMTVEEVALDDVPALVAAGELTDAKTLIGLFAARDRLARGGGDSRADPGETRR